MMHTQARMQKDRPLQESSYVAVAFQRFLGGVVADVLGVRLALQTFRSASTPASRSLRCMRAAGEDD
jgi:hypothetical protein